MATADPDDAAGARRAFVLGRSALAVTCCALVALALGVFTQVTPTTAFLTHSRRESTEAPEPWHPRTDP
jgi:hypothetical protein